MHQWTQTGDIPHVAGALTLRPNIDALILYDAGLDISPLQALYKRAASVAPGSRNDRVSFVSISPSQVPDPQKMLYNTLKNCFNLLSPTASQTNTFKAVLGDSAYTNFKVCIWALDRTASQAIVQD